MQNRLKSPVLWGAAAGIVLLVLKNLGLEAEMTEGAALAGKVFEFLCAGMAIFGIANNPTNKSGF